MKFTYRAMLARQTKSEKAIVLFSANAVEVDQWVGVPQKRRLGTDSASAETSGFQREENPARIKSLRDFYSNQDNLIQNPLLCAIRRLPDAKVTFEADQQEASSEEDYHTTTIGQLVIELPDYQSLPLRDIFGRVRAFIEERVPDLADESPRNDLIDDLKRDAHELGHITHLGDSDVDGDDDILAQPDEDATDEDSDSSLGDNGDAASVLFDESHIADFWNEIAARHEILKELETSPNPDEFLGFTRNALVSFLQPIVLVDGQHRLRGAIEAARAAAESKEALDSIERRVSGGEASEDVAHDMMTTRARHLPISLMMSDDPAEQVFQFVVVNQKATPVGRALLGTIVSTTLSNEEMQRVADRLKNAGIPLEESQAVTFLARHPASPFCGLVERGLTGDAKDLLKWNVFSSLISIFRHLQGGRLFGQRNDYASLWRQRHLDQSALVSEYAGHNFDSAFKYWSSIDGPWRDVFMRFWALVRDRFANTEDPDRPNYWGKPRDSNLFNKITLTILAADFFQFLVDSRSSISSVDQIDELVDQWLEHVNEGYFDKDWDLSGVKKDSTGIRNQWAEIWVDYRKAGGQLPDKRNYRKPKLG